MQVRQHADGINDHGPAVIENFLKLIGGQSALVRSQINQATHINWIEGSEVPIDGATRLAQLIRHSGLQQFCRLCRIAIGLEESAEPNPTARSLNNKFTRSRKNELIGIR